MKVVEGQMQVWEMVSDASRISDSIASQSIREFVGQQAEQQAFTPDVLPKTVDIHSTIEANTGKVVDNIG